MSRTALLAVLLLVLTGCAGDDPVVDGPPVSATPEVVATEALDGDDLGSDESLQLALEGCADGIATDCEVAAAGLSPDEVDAIIAECTEGDESSCAVLEALFADADPSEQPTGYAEALDALEEGEERPGSLVVLTGAGAEIEGEPVFFGDDADLVVAELSAALGTPSDDTGYLATGDGSGCPGTEYRSVTWAEMTITILDESAVTAGDLHFAAWQTTGPTVSAASFVGDTTLIPIDVGLTRVLDLRESIPEDSLEVLDAPPVGASFVIEDNFGQLRGSLSTLADDGVVQSVSSGSGCGE